MIFAVDTRCRFANVFTRLRNTTSSNNPNPSDRSEAIRAIRHALSDVGELLQRHAVEGLAVDTWRQGSLVAGDLFVGPLEEMWTSHQAVKAVYSLARPRQGRQSFNSPLDGDGLHQQNLSVEEPPLCILQMPLLAASSFPRAEALSIRSPGLIRMLVRLATAVPVITPGIWVL
jgi:hypothetical protein